MNELKAIDTFGYDKNGVLIKTANKQMSLKFERNQAGCPAWTTRMRYNELGQESERIVPGQVVSQWRYDASGKPLQHLIGNGRQRTRNREYRWGIRD